MAVERSAGAVIFRETKGGKEYLLLLHHPSRIQRKRDKEHWDFPKGHIEKGEKTEDAVRREVKEETGIAKIEIVPGFKETIRYVINYKGEKRLKFVAFFLARTRATRIALSREHRGFCWLPFEAAYDRVTYAQTKSVLKKAHHFLRNASV